MSEKLIITVHAERDEQTGDITIDKSLTGGWNELGEIMATVLKEDPELFRIISRALYLMDDEYIQVEEEMEDLVEIFENASKTRH